MLARLDLVERVRQQAAGVVEEERAVDPRVRRRVGDAAGTAPADAVANGSRSASPTTSGRRPGERSIGTTRRSSRSLRGRFAQVPLPQPTSSTGPVAPPSAPRPDGKRRGRLTRPVAALPGVHPT
ncbi:hypothetical protein [Tenggerimyces flavus]|uniref:hypothetical protein n=1 Tax=Tenggerimyces flavus TaxID=1708749 RepID=UPI001960F983|nr:hypothetical protein [Tenggerimyces flavus]